MSGSPCSFCGRGADGTWFPSTCKDCGKIFCPYHSFPRDHNCVSLFGEKDVHSEETFYMASLPNSRGTRNKRIVVTASVVVILLVLSTVAAIYVLPAAESALLRANQSSFNTSPQNVTSDFLNASYTYSGATTDQYGTPNSDTTTTSNPITQQQVIVDESWVSSFVAVLNGARDQKGLSNLTYAPVLTQFAQTRFNTMVSNYEISHYGYNADFQQYLAGGTSLEIEEVLFSSGFSPYMFMTNLEAYAPIHYSSLFTSALTKYGYFLASGPTYEIQEPCPVSEIPGPNINITQYYDQNSCHFTIISSVWFVLELST